MNTFALALLLLYVVVLFFLAWRSSRKETDTQYVIADRKVGVLATIASLTASFRDGAGLSAWVILTAYFGFGSLWLTIGLCSALLVLAFVAPKMRVLAQKKKYITLGDAIKDRVGPKTAFVASLCIIVTAFLYAASQLFVSGTIIGLLFSVPTIIGIVFVGLIVGMYLYAGGYSTVVKTDVLQWGIMLTIIALPFFLATPALDSTELQTFLGLDFVTAIGFFGIAFLFIFVGADTWQRIFSAKSARVVKQSLLGTIPVYILVSLGIVFLGYTAIAALPGVPAPALFFSLFTPASGIPPLFVAVLGVFAAASVMSTLDTQLFVFASSLTENIFPKRKKKMRIRLYRIILAVSSVVLIGIAVFIHDLVTFLFGAISLITLIIPAVILMIVGNKDKVVDTLLMLAILIAAVPYVWMFIAGYFETTAYTVIPALISLALAAVFVSARKVFSA